jgi:hypothetical protein
MVDQMLRCTLARCSAKATHKSQFVSELFPVNRKRQVKALLFFHSGDDCAGDNGGDNDYDIGHPTRHYETISFDWFG